MTPRVTAIVAVHNEADVIEQTVTDLIANGIDVYVLDDGSTDGGLELIRPKLGHGVVGIESLPTSATFALRQILQRKEELACALDADWFINQDADELRESPWPHLDLRRAIGLVDRLGWNAVDFELLDFRPTHDDFCPGSDLRATFTHFERGRAFDRPQVRAWKRQPAVDLQTSGGHDVQFPDRRVFPIRFLLRHYPVRNQHQGTKKVFEERLGRMSESERRDGWHVQYGGLQPGHSFIRNAADLTEFDSDAERVRLLIQHREVEDALASQRALAARLREALERGAFIEHELGAQLDAASKRADSAEAASDTLAFQLDESHRLVGRLRADLASTDSLISGQAEAIGHLTEELEQSRRARLETERHATRAANEVLQATSALETLSMQAASVGRELEAVYRSRTWRWTATARRVAAALGLR